MTEISTFTSTTLRAQIDNVCPTFASDFDFGLFGLYMKGSRWVMDDAAAVLSPSASATG